jgi:hypothetical protein
MGSDGARVALAVRFLQAGERWLARRGAPVAPDGRCGEGPLTGGVPARRACGASPRASRGLGPRAQAAGGDDSWPAGDAREVMDGLAPRHAAARAQPRERAPPGERVGVVGLGRAAEGQCHVAAQVVIGADQGQRDLDPLLDGGVRTPLGHANAGRVVGELLPPRGPVLRAVGLRERGQPRRPLAPPMPPPEPIPWGAQGGRRPRRLWAPPATARARNVVRVDRVVFRVAPRARVQSARVPEDTRHPVARPEGGPPRAGAEAFDADEPIGPVRCHGVETRG